MPVVTQPITGDCIAPIPTRLQTWEWEVWLGSELS